jgi:hypothetical protein
MTIAREKDLDSHQAATHDLVVMGLPEDPRLKRAIQDRVILHPQGFDLDGQAYREATDCFFGVWPHPLSQEHTMAVMLYGSQHHLETIARKIPHYGRYSFLVFAETTNRVKGTWPTASSPLVHVWPSVPPDSP